MITLDEALTRLDRAARLGTTGRHKWYTHLVEQAETLTILATGVGTNQFLTQFERREDSLDWAQRKKLTIPKTNPVLAPAIAQFHRTSRLKINRSLSYGESTDNDVVNRTLAAMTEFYGEEGVDEYLATVYDWASLIDPGAFVAVEFDRTQTKINPFGVCYWSRDIYEFGRNRQKQTTYLLVEQPQRVLMYNAQSNTKKELDIVDYIVYCGSHVIKYSQLGVVKDEVRLTENGDVFELVATDTYQADPIYVPDPENKPDTRWLRQVWESKCPFVQAFPLGYLPDPLTNFETFKSALDPAVPILIDILRTGSNFDLTKFSHVFQQKIVGGIPCPGVGDNKCNKGYQFEHPQLKCNVCHGTGVITHTGPTDALVVGVKDMNEIPDLAKLIHYVQPELGTFEALSNNLKEMQTQVQVAIFNTEILPTANGVQAEPTATAINERKDNSNNTLFPFMKHKSSGYRFFVKCIAVFVTDPALFVEDKLKVVYDAPKDLKPLLLSELYIDLKNATDSGAPNFVIEQIVYDIAAKIYEDNDEAHAHFLVKARFVPFIGLSESWIQFLIGAGYIRKKDIVMLAYADTIFTDLERKYPKFYDLKDPERDKLITDYRDQILNELPNSATLSIASPMAKLGLNQPTTETPL